MIAADSLSPFYRTFAVRAQPKTGGGLTLVAPRMEQFSNPGNIMHGGYYCCIGAAAADLLVVQEAGLDAGFEPLDYKVNLFRPMRMGGDATADAKVVHRGRRSVVIVTELRDESSRLACLMTVTFGAVTRDAPVEDFRPPLPVPTSGEPIPSKGPSASRFFQSFGIDVTETRRGYARVTAPYSERFSVADGSLHPSFLVGVADSAAGPCSGTIVGEGEAVSTIEYKVSIVRPIRAGMVIADGYVISARGDTILVRVDVKDSEDRLCALMLTTLTRVPKAV